MIMLAPVEVQAWVSKIFWEDESGTVFWWHWLTETVTKLPGNTIPELHIIVYAFVSNVCAWKESRRTSALIAGWLLKFDELPDYTCGNHLRSSDSMVPGQKRRHV